MKIKMIILVFLATCLFVTSDNVWATDEVTQPADESSFKGETKVIADVKIRNMEISEIEKNRLKLTFAVENLMEIQSGMVYGIELIKKIGENKFVLSDMQIFQNDPMTVEKGNLVKREIIYQAPEHLSGDYFLWLKIKDESGLILSTRSFNVNFSGTDSYIDQGDSCFLTIEGEKDKKYSLIQGVDLKKDEILYLDCQARNLSSETVEVLPSFEFYQRDIYGNKIKEYQSTEAIIFGKGEEKIIKLRVDLPENPQAYDVKVVLKKGDSVFSNPVVAHFVLSGKSGTIINASLDKSNYVKGDTAQLIILWAGSADTFLESRTGGSFLVEPNFEVEFKDANGMECGEKTIHKAGEYETILNISLNKDCLYPVATVKLVDDGKMLYQKIITTEPEKEKKQPEVARDQKEEDNSILAIMGLLAVALVGSISGLVYWKMRKERIGNTSLWFFVLLAPFFLFNQVEAATTTLYGNPGWFTGAESIMTGASFVDATTCGTITPINGALISGLVQCPLLERNRTGPCKISSKIIWESGTYYGCYQDIVNFYYELYNSSGSATTSFNQGDTIIMGGSFQGINICNNGITGLMEVIPRRYVDAFSDRKLLVNLWTNNSLVYGGQYNADTSGWSCGNYAARFLFGFNHVTVEPGADSINYSVSNCCSATCATGPGCQASLTNGSVTSGTCCSGSCYQCNAGYYWTGSMCTADCSTWSASLSPAPASGNATLTVDLTASITGGGTYTYANHSCGAGGPAPTNVSGANFTCVYPAAGTFTPSVRVTAQSNSCVKTPSTTVTVSAVAITNNAQCVSVTGVPATIAPGGTFSAQVTMRNIGTKTWNSDASPHRLGSASPQDNLNWGLNRINLPVASVAQNSQTTFTVNATAPATAGTYNFDWRMVEDFIEWFGPICSGGPVSVVVTNPGVCGLADTNSPYPYTATAYTGAFCAPGIANPLTPAFPTDGGPAIDWTCTNDGISVPCSAIRDCAPSCLLSANPCTNCGTLQPNMPYCIPVCGGDCSTNPWCTGTTDCGACSSGKWLEK